MVKTLSRQFARYLLVGGTAAVIDFAVFQLVLALWQQDVQLWTWRAEQWANSAGMVLGFLFTFFANRQWTFASDGAVLKQMLLAIGLLWFNILLGAVIISALIRDAAWSPTAAKLSLQIAVVVWNFAIYKFVIYGRR